MLMGKKPDQLRTVDKSVDLVSPNKESSILLPIGKRRRSLCDAVLDMQSEIRKLQCVRSKIGASLQKLAPDAVTITMTPNSTRAGCWLTRDLIDASNQLNTSITQMNQQIGFIATSISEKEEYHSSCHTRKSGKCLASIDHKVLPCKQSTLTTERILCEIRFGVYFSM